MGLREERKRQRLSLEALAYLSDVDVGNVSRIERGLVTPKPRTVVKLARGLGISVERCLALLEAEKPSAAAS